jgi:hypothetical protein
LTSSRERGSMLRTIAVAIGVMALAVACTRPPFQRYLDEGRWADATAAFNADSSLMNDDWALLQAARLYSSPDRGAYDLGKARILLQRLLARNPQSKYRDDAASRLALIEGVLHERDSVAAQRRALDDRIVQLTSDTRRLRASLDSVSARSDTLQRNVSRIELDLRDREDQLRALRLELSRLKEIDLNPRPAPKPPQR